LRSEFSEFSYGFSLSYEIMNALRPNYTGYPLFPSLVEEAMKGFDVSFSRSGWPLFLQFKLSQYMTSPSALHWSDFDAPHFRFKIHKRKRAKIEERQHNRLKELSKSEPDVYYAAPLFHLETEFDNAFVNDKIFMKTMFISMSDLPEITDNDDHYIVFCDDKNLHWHSENNQSFDHGMIGTVFLDSLNNRTPKRLDYSYFRSLREDLFNIVRSSEGQSSFLSRRELLDDSIGSVLEDIRYILSAKFGVEMILFFTPIE